MALKLMVDTCVWLDLAKDYRAQPILHALSDLIKGRKIELVVPRVVPEEFERNKARVIAEAQRSFQSHFKIVRDAVVRFGDDASKPGALKALSEIDHRIFIEGEAVNDSIALIEKLIKSGRPMNISSEIKQRVAERALAKKAPYHRDKNSVADAIIIELYAQSLSSPRNRRIKHAFLSHNIRDFSDTAGDQRKPHGDLLNLFGSTRSTYWISMPDFINSIDPDLVADHDMDLSFSQQPRRLSEILEAEHLLFRQVWYNRHWNLRTEIEEGTHHVVAAKDYSTKPYRQDQTLNSIWAGALAAAKRTEEEVGIENLGPWTDFEWGMLNGKLSALRWVMGDEWDMLDT